MPGLTYITSCSLCPQQFTHYGFSDLMQTNPHQLIKIIETLSNHIKDKHPKEFAETVAPGMMLAGLLRSRYFRSQDQSFLEICDRQRFEIHERTRKNHVSDEKIAAQVEALQLPAEFQPRVLTAIKLMRDIIEERGQFQPKAPIPPGPSTETGTAAHKPVLVS